MKKERVIRSVQYLYSYVVSHGKKSYCFAVCDKVIMLSIYDTPKIARSDAKPQPLKIRDKKNSDRFKYSAWITIDKPGKIVRGKTLFSKQYKIPKGTDVNLLIKKIVATECLGEETT
jgi:hypothetical protein